MGWQKRLGCATVNSVLFAILGLYLLHVLSAFYRNANHHWAESTAAFETVELCSNAAQVAKMNMYARCAKDREWRDEGFWLPMWYLTVDEERHHWTEFCSFLPASRTVFTLAGFVMGRFPEYALLTIPYALGMIGLLASAFRRFVVRQWVQGLDERQQTKMHECEMLAALLRSSDVTSKVPSCSSTSSGQMMNLPPDANAFNVWPEVPQHDSFVAPPPRGSPFRLNERDRV
jgi:hypothetical protein